MKESVQYLLAFLSILGGAMGQIFMKEMMKAAGPFPFGDMQQWGVYLLSLLTSHFLWLTFLSYGISVALWLILLSYLDLSFLRPLMSAGYLITLLYGIYAGEDVTKERIAGTILIIAGVYFLTKR